MQHESMRFTIPVLFSSQLLLFLRALGHFSHRICDKMLWDRLCVVCEEYVTNFFKYGRKGRSKPCCWFRIEIKGKQVRCLFSDTGRRFNPIEHIGKSPGLRLITQLLDHRYRWQHNRNYFYIKMVT